MPDVVSSMMTQVEYDPTGRELLVIFTSGRRYVYGGVPTEIYDALLAAPSKGQYFNEEIRDAFPSSRLTGRRAPGRR